MKEKVRNAVLFIIAMVTIMAAILISNSDVEDRIDFSTVVEIWSDLVRDVDHIGLTGTRVSASREMKVGKDLADGIESRWRVSEDTARQRYVEAVGKRLLDHVQRKNIEYRFTILDSPEVNAFAVAGGQIYVTTGMLDFLKNEAELAAVLGHEINHVDLRHCIELLQYELLVRKIAGNAIGSLTTFGHLILRLGFSEQQEIDADTTGLLLSAYAEYDPHAAIKLFNRLAAKHPPSSTQQKARTITGELGVAVLDAFSQYFETHPHFIQRLEHLKTAYGRNESSWREREFYIGQSNYEELIPRSQDERQEEWISFVSLKGTKKKIQYVAPPQAPKTAGEPSVDMQEAPQSGVFKRALEHYEKKNYQEAIALWKQLAMKGDPEAAFRLSEMYIRGLGVNKNPNKSGYWMEIAAERGQQEAQYRLASRHRSATGVPKDKYQAYRWFSICAQGQPGRYSNSCDIEARRMFARTKAESIRKRYLAIENEVSQWKPLKGWAYIELNLPTEVYAYGSVKYVAQKGDTLELLGRKVCRGGSGECWHVRLVTTGVTGYGAGEFGYGTAKTGYVSAEEMHKYHLVSVSSSGIQKLKPTFTCPEANPIVQCELENGDLVYMGCIACKHAGGKVAINSPTYNDLDSRQVPRRQQQVDSAESKVEVTIPEQPATTEFTCPKENPRVECQLFRGGKIYVSCSVCKQSGGRLIRVIEPTKQQ